MRKHSRLNRNLVMEITAKEVRDALIKKKLFGTKELSELEDRIFGKVMFEMQFMPKEKVDTNIHKGTKCLTEYSEQTNQRDPLTRFTNANMLRNS